MSFKINVLKLMSGTILGQLISFIVMPLITRMYTPSDMGKYALFMSITTIFAVIINLRMEQTILIARYKKLLNAVVAVSFLSTFIITVLLLILLLIFQYFLTIDWLFFLLVIVAIFVSGLYQILNYLALKLGLFKDIALRTVIQTVVNLGLSIILFKLFYSSYALLIAYISAQSVAALLLYRSVKFNYKFKFSTVSKIFYSIKRYRDFLGFGLISGLLNTASLQLPISIMAFLFTKSDVGSYSLSYRVIIVPLGLIGASVGQTYYQKIASCTTRVEITEITTKVENFLFGAAVIPFCFLFLLADKVFPFVFGVNWYFAGQICQVLAPWFFMVLITSPLTNIFTVLEKQKAGFYFNLLIFSSRVVSLTVGKILFNNFYHSIILFSAVGFISFVILWFYCKRLLGFSLAYFKSFGAVVLSLIIFSLVRVVL